MKLYSLILGAWYICSLFITLWQFKSGQISKLIFISGEVINLLFLILTIFMLFHNNLNLLVVAIVGILLLWYGLYTWVDIKAIFETTGTLRFFQIIYSLIDVASYIYLIWVLFDSRTQKYLLSVFNPTAFNYLYTVVIIAPICYLTQIIFIKLGYHKRVQNGSR